MPDHVLLDAKQIEMAIASLADQIQEHENIQSGEFALVGIRTHGMTIARQLLECLQVKLGVEIDFGVLDITLYRDDLHQRESAPIVQSTEINFDLNAKKIILVDDVLYTGRTIRAALNALADYGRPKFIKLAVLIDRGGRELPIHPCYVGKVLEMDDKHMVKLILDDDRQEAIQLDH